jgi:hypothetical protein
MVFLTELIVLVKVSLTFNAKSRQNELLTINLLIIYCFLKKHCIFADHLKKNGFKANLLLIKTLD